MIPFTHAPLFVPDSTRAFVCAMADTNSLVPIPIAILPEHIIHLIHALGFDGALPNHK